MSTDVIFLSGIPFEKEEGRLIQNLADTRGVYSKGRIRGYMDDGNFMKTKKNLGRQKNIFFRLFALPY